MEILKKPLVTEKLTKEAAKYNRFGFVVDKRANKIEIKNAIEKLYNVTIESVRTLTYAGKIKTRHTKGGVLSGNSGAFKKAIVTLKSGDTIDFYSNI